ncbi:MAG: RecQ family ATP-dependent DNA helicase [Alistipes sp.]|nr:RecQ family ATP-dependent DNA helicase [Alistipes sp.]
MPRRTEHIEQDIHLILKKYWGYSAFRPGQQSVIESILQGRDTLALMPTGGGKSLTYQIPALAKEGLCVVVTPLISLMKDQCDKLRSRGISAVAVHSGLSYSQIDILLDNCVYGDVKFLFVAPERLATEVFRLRVQRMKVALLTVDEAHCISQWGYDFRPSYLRIAEVRRYMPDVPVLALTASATPRVVEDIMDKLQFSTPNIIRNSFARPNLSYAVRHVEDKEEQLLRIINNVEGSGIIYLRSREGCEKLTENLINQGISVSYYHAGLPHAEREIRQEEWIEGNVRIMVATNAFGMGIDKADVRFVIHYTECDSLENYYQEAGRAGRDGKRSYAVLLTSADDRRRIVQLADSEFPPIEQVKLIYDKIGSYLQVAIGDGYSSAFTFDIYDFCHREHLYAGTVRAALKLLQQNGYLTLTDEMTNPARVIFTVSRDDLYKIPIARQDLDDVMRAMMRLYNGIFTEFRPIEESRIAAVSGYSVEHVKQMLKLMWQMHIIRYIPVNHLPLIFYEVERLDIKNLYISPESYLHRRELVHERLDAMQQYADNDTECRSMVLQRYFGDTEATPCGVCDICLSRRKKATSLEDDILALLRLGPCSARDISCEIKAEPEAIALILNTLQKQGKISRSKSGKLSIIE